MAARQQQVRLHFLIALTLAVMVFGAARFVRTYRQRQLRTASLRTAQELHQFVRPEEDKLQDLAMTARGSLAPDAAALLMQARYLIEKDLEEPSAASSRHTSAALAQSRANLKRLRAGEPAVFPRGSRSCAPTTRSWTTPSSPTASACPTPTLATTPTP